MDNLQICHEVNVMNSILRKLNSVIQIKSFDIYSFYAVTQYTQFFSLDVIKKFEHFYDT